ncbi:hypothetical protein MESS4_140001 [Mesorhizobium sp. STM 4661]|nr:hypothetical protein MESS4_140001 [Mesorhizobium sp. STM 4661]
MRRRGKTSLINVSDDMREACTPTLAAATTPPRPSLQRVRRDRIAILAPPSKLALLGPAGFFVDTGDAEVDRMLGGYIKVRTAPRREMVMRVRGD